MTLGSILEALIMMAVLCLFALFTGYYLSKQVSGEGVNLRFTNKVMFELKAIFGTILIMITLIVLALGAVSSVSNILQM